VVKTPRDVCDENWRLSWCGNNVLVLGGNTWWRLFRLLSRLAFGNKNQRNAGACRRCCLPVRLCEHAVEHPHDEAPLGAGELGDALELLLELGVGPRLPVPFVAFIVYPAYLQNSAACKRFVREGLPKSV
jgi:hypothetical protein